MFYITRQHLCLVLICHQPTYSCHAVLPEKMFQYAYRSCLQDWLSRSLLLTHLQSCLVFTGMLVVRRTCDVSCSQLACEWQTFLLAHRRWGTFREEERLRLSDRNSILMTQNMSRIRSEALIGRRSSFIVLATVYEWQTKDKRRQRSSINVMNL